MTNKKNEPDYNAGFHGGGKPKDFKGKLVFRFPGPKKRGIDCNIYTWAGTCPGAKHYHATVKEEDNTCWSPKEKAWCKPWGKDPRFDGFREDARFDTLEDAYRWMRCIVREKAKMETHQVRFNDHTSDEPVPPFFWSEREKKPEPVAYVDPFMDPANTSEVGFYKKLGDQED